MKTRTRGRQAQRQTDPTQTSTRGEISMPVMITSIVLVFALPRQTKVVEIFLLLFLAAALIGMGFS
jgi:hypothetical protein